MAVYVDDMDMPAKVGNIQANWSHLTADDTEELHTFASRLGLKRSWFQEGKVWVKGPKAGQKATRDHYDVTSRVKAKAIALGAVAVPFGNEPWRDKSGEF